MQIRERNEEGMASRGLAARGSPLTARSSREVRSIALKTLGKERDCSQSKLSTRLQSPKSLVVRSIV